MTKLEEQKNTSQTASVQLSTTNKVKARAAKKGKENDAIN